jgi:O-antigen biosynthesis protein WbqP
MQYCSLSLFLVEYYKLVSFFLDIEKTYNRGKKCMVYLKIKRIIDIILSGIGLIILSPVFLVLIIAIKLDSPGPVLFKQKRVGIHKSRFHILKFRTMRIDTPKDTPTHLLENPDQWITMVGKFLRKTSLDELPQIINILKGEMRLGDRKEISLQIQ